MKWTIKDGIEFYPDPIIARANSLKEDPECLIIRENNVRISMLIPLEDGSEKKVFFKKII